jgi:uncharacterized cupin superfamily protein
MAQIKVVSSTNRDGWDTMADPPGEIPSRCREMATFTGGEGAFETGLWEREPDTWPFERAYDEVAIILQGAGEIELDNGDRLRVRAGDVLVTPKGTKGVWHVQETIVKFFAIYDA